MISLIVATLDRTSELERLLDSLDRQTFKDFEVIVIDQNPDDRLVPILACHRQLAIRRLRSSKGLSRARNVGLPHAQGELICFPDDDCWYPPDLLARVRECFDLHPECGAVFAVLRDKDSQTIGPKWPEHSCYWTKEDVWTNGISPAGFVRGTVARAIGPFDERIGVGASTPYQSGEDVDYFVRVPNNGWKIWYESSLTVHHPAFHRIDRVRERSYSYALGGGYTLRAHQIRAGRFAVSFVRSLGGALVFLLQGKFVISRCYLLRAAGLTRGYLFGPADLKRTYAVTK